MNGLDLAKGVSTAKPYHWAREAGRWVRALPDDVRLGLLDPRDGLFGFRDLAAARQISKLLSAGVSLSTVIRSLHEIRRWLPEAGLANLRLLPDGNGLVVDQG